MNLRNILKPIVLFAGLLCFSLQVSAQQVSKAFDGQTLKEVIKEVERQTGLSVIYKTDDLNENKRITANFQNAALADVMRQILGEGLNYKLQGKMLIIAKAEEQKQSTQTRKVSGVIIDTQGGPVVGATIRIKGTDKGTVTDADGRFSMVNVPENAIIIVSFIGYHTLELPANSKSLEKIIMKEDSKALEEVVVVGYGTQKRVNLTGAVEQVSGDVFENRPMSNITQGLQGAVPNLNITLSDGKPSRSADFNVRGTTSIGQGGSALVLIDGVEGDPAMLNPNDIASVSVLKDAASASIYGARGAFGVVLITTKNPNKERTSITFSSNHSLKSPTVVPDMVTDTYIYTNMFVEAYSSFYDYTRNPSSIHKAVKYTQDWHNNLATRRPGMGMPEVETDASGNYLYYANFDWYGELYKKSMQVQEYNLNVQGGNDKADFMASGRFFDQDGIFRYNSDKYNIYNIRAKGSAQIFDWLKIENNMEFSKMRYHNPLTVADGNVWYGLESEAEPMSPMFNPDGTLTMAAAYSVGDLWYNKNGTDTDRKIFRNTSSAIASFMNNKLRVKGDITFRNTDRDEQTRRVQIPYSSKKGVISYLGSSTNDLGVAHGQSQYLATNIYTEYENTFNKMHYVKGMVGYNYEQSIYNYLLTKRNGLIFEDADNLNMANGSGIKIASSYEKWRIAGGFFRLNYAFKDRYLVEVNGRMDGSTKFPKDQQWAFFPSISTGWRISEEPFWHVNRNILSDMKLRYSYGSLGNGNVSSYAYRELFSISQMGYMINGALKQKTSLPTIVPDGLTWETATTSNFGLDFGSFDGKLRFSGDMYVRKTKDMFTVGPVLPAVFGAKEPYGNYADMTTRGWELSLSWHDKIRVADKPFNYEVRFTLADYTSKIDKYNNPEKFIGNYVDARTEFYTGMTIGEIWGYETEGFFTSKEDVANHASQKLFFASNSGTWLPGDIKFKDINGDNVIDYGTNKVGDSGDKRVIGNTTPRYNYSFNLSADWNGIFVSAFFQGVGKQDWWPGTDNALFWGQYNRPYNNIPSSMIGNIWKEDNPNAYFPRYRGYVALQGTRELSVVQTKYLQNVAYLRLKNLQVGYNLPKKITSAARMQAARIYLSAENLFCWSPLYKHTKNFDVANIYGEDREAQAAASDGGYNSIIGNGGQSYNYPLLKSLSLGLSVTF